MDRPEQRLVHRCMSVLPVGCLEREYVSPGRPIASVGPQWLGNVKSVLLQKTKSSPSFSPLFLFLLLVLALCASVCTNQLFSIQLWAPRATCHPHTMEGPFLVQWWQVKGQVPSDSGCPRCHHLCPHAENIPKFGCCLSCTLVCFFVFFFFRAPWGAAAFRRPFITAPNKLSDEPLRPARHHLQP